MKIVHTVHVYTFKMFRSRLFVPTVHNMTDTDTTVESDLANPKRRAVDSNLPNPKRRLEVVSDCYLKIIGTRYEVWKGDALKTKGGLRRENLFLDKHGKVASIKTSQQQM